MSIIKEISPEISIPTSESPPGRRRLVRKFLLVAAAAVIIIILGVALLTPQGAATIPLNINYNVGEKMIYDADISVAMRGFNLPNTTGIGLNQNSISTNATIALEVLSFDGETYTLNNTTTMNLLGSTQSISMIQKINKTGFSTFMFNTPNQELSYNTSMSSILTSLLDKPDVKVGETWQVPVPGLQGNLTLTFNGLEDLTVPAGTYKVYKVSISSDNLTTQNLVPEGLSNQNIEVRMSVNGQTYVEYNTGRQIKYNMQTTASAAISEIEFSVDMSSNMTLAKHVLP